MRSWDFFLVPYSGDSKGLKVGVHLEFERGEMRFRFGVEGSGVKHAPYGVGGRRDELWKTTCFEFFLAPATGTKYFEINMATSGDWNAYAFDSYRDGMRRAESVKRSPLQEVRASDDSLELRGRFVLSDFPLQGPVALGATAVVEYLDGTKDYWALAHTGDKPDFHIRSSFTALIQE